MIIHNTTVYESEDIMAIAKIALPANYYEQKELKVRYMNRVHKSWIGGSDYEFWYARRQSRFYSNSPLEISIVRTKLLDANPLEALARAGLSGEAIVSNSVRDQIVRVLAEMASKYDYARTVDTILKEVQEAGLTIRINDKVTNRVKNALNSLKKKVDSCKFAIVVAERDAIYCHGMAERHAAKALKKKEDLLDLEARYNKALAKSKKKENK